MAIKDYSTDPDQNVKISGINIAEGCAPSGINNAIRQLMADVKAESDTKANASTFGKVKLSDSTSSSSAASAGVAATPKAVKAAYDKATTAINSAAAKVATVNGLAPDSAGNVDVGGEFVGMLDGKADKAQVASAETINAEGRARIVGWGMPDYTAGVAITSGASAPSNGYVKFDLTAYLGGSYGQGKVNNVLVAEYNSLGGTYGTHNRITFLVPVAKGDIITFPYGGTNGYAKATFYPMRGI